MEDEEKKEEIKIIENLHPAGGFDKYHGLVYEPLGEKKYLFKIKGRKGIGTATSTAIINCPSCGAERKILNAKVGQEARCGCGKRTTIQKIDYELITDIEYVKFLFKGKPLNKIIFNIPSNEAINFWLSVPCLLDENKKEIDENFVFDKLVEYYTAFFDFPIARSPYILACSSLQSWLQEILDVLFFSSISGESESGKTALLEAMADVSKHGFLAANIRQAGIARCTEKYKLSLMIDEIDNKRNQEDDIEGICRQGYRRGQFYVRMMPKSHEPEFFVVFGFKAFSYRSEIIDDLQNRSIDIPLSRTKNKELPVINLFKQYFSPFELVFFWYMDNIANLYTRSPTFLQDMNRFERDKNVNNVKSVNGNLNNLIKYNNININNNISIYNKEVSRNSIADRTPYLVNFSKIVKDFPIFGRNIEIAYLIYSLSQILNIDIEKILVETIEQKQEIEEASHEEGWSGVLRDLLVEEFAEASEKEEMKVVPYKKIIGKYIRRMKEVYDYVPSSHQIRKLLRQVGFVDGINRKVLWLEDKARLCLIYDKKIKENLKISEPEQEKLKMNNEETLPIAQEQERVAVEESKNHEVAGSSPAGEIDSHEEAKSKG